MSKAEYIIEQLLVREGKVFLPALGVLTLQRDAANIDVTRQKISPPRDSLHFLASDFIQKEHLSTQLHKLPLPENTSVEKLAGEVNSFLQSAIKEGEFTIGGFALFKKGENSDEFEFEALDVHSISPLGDLPELSLPATGAVPTTQTGPAIKEAVGVDKASDAIQEKEEEEKKEKSWLFPAMLTLLILILSFMVWWFTPALMNGGDDFTKLLVNDERVNISPEEAEDKRKAEEKELAENENEVTASDSPAMASNDIGNDSEEMMDTFAAGGETANEEIEEETTSPYMVDDCVVVVGAFAKSFNVDRMKNRLREAGYEVFSQDINGLTRVGLYASCISEKLDSVLNVARQEIEEEAWLLE